MIRTLLLAGILLAWLCGTPGCPALATAAKTFEECADIVAKDERLECYDGVANQRKKIQASATQPAGPSDEELARQKADQEARERALREQAILDQETRDKAAAAAAGELAGCIVECKGEKEKCDAERLRCFDDKAKYSWSTCITSSILWKQKSPEILNACKYFFEDTERLYGYDKLAGFEATTDAARAAAGDLAKCKGETDPAKRLHCYDGKAKYSWSKCMGGNFSWVQERPERLNACKYIIEDTERLYGYDEITGFEPTTPGERYKPSYLSIKWRLNEESRQLDEKRRLERFVKKREELDQESRQLGMKIIQMRLELDEKRGQLNEEKRNQLDEEIRRAINEKIRVEMNIRQINEENTRALAEENRLGRLALAYQQNYILFGTYNFHPDKQLWESANGGMELQDYESKFQLSLKLKLFDITDNSVTGDWERHLGMHIDLWIAYTQLSFWQIYNASISRPFRETNYEPELILNGRMDKDLFYDWKLRFIQIALNHQSNGQSDPLSRSWNRLMFNFGFERENIDVVLKTWYRFPESTNDDNPDIESYLGYGQLSAGYRSNLLGIDWRFSLMFRNNLRFDNENRSALQLGVEANLFGPLNLYVQYFTGYGESLINYNSYANTIGAGVSVKDW
jgi:phospholipase A1/A2